jgi:hypothetical protein
MLISRSITFDELKILHQKAVDRVETALSDLYDGMDHLCGIDWRASLRDRDTRSEISVWALNVMEWSVELDMAQRDLNRINKKRLKMVGGKQ